MIDSKSPKQAQVKTVAAPKSSGPKSSTDNVVKMPNPVPSPDRTRERAYELYETRGRGPGQDEQDWLRAEQEILKRTR